MTKRNLAWFFVPAVLIVFCAISTLGQTPTGTPPYSSIGGGAPDLINFANLNVHVSVPIVSRTGRGIPFNFGIAHDSSGWVPMGTSPYRSWVPSTGVSGWTVSSPTGGGLSYSQYDDICIVYEEGYPFVEGETHDVSNVEFIDPSGTPHLFAGATDSAYADTGTACPTYSGSITETITDGSGYYLQLTLSVRGVVDATVTSPSGVVFDMAGATVTDTNGNRITEASNVFTDTLNATALTIAGAGTPASPTTYTYPAPSGSATYTVKYTSYNVKTNFSCSGVNKYSQSNINLVSEIDLPDSTKYTFTYEDTPSYSGYKTGRIASITLPTGGTIYYTYPGDPGYSGSNNGIECSDGSTAAMTRVTPDGTWTYSRTLGSGAASTTTVTDPQGNQTVINFQGNYETERQVYTGSSSSGTLLETTYTCYNYSGTYCNSTAVSLPITSIVHSVQWPGGLESESARTYNSDGLVTEVDEYSYGTASTGPLARKTLTVYNTSLTNHVVDRPASVTVEDSSNNVKAKTTFCYDEGSPSGTATCASSGSPTTTSGTPQHVSITGSRGNLTTVASLVSGSTTLGKKFTYYDTGTLNTATDLNGAVTTYTYGTGSCGNSFPTSVSEPLSLTKSMTWNCTGGVELTATDENSKTVYYDYGSNTSYWLPDDMKDQLGNQTNFTYTPAGSGVSASVEGKMTFNTGNSVKDMLSTVDGLGRLHVSQVKQGPSATNFDSVETDYDSLGRAYRSTVAYNGTAGQTSSSAPSTLTTYDSMGRATQVADSASGGRTMTTSYSQNDIYQTLGPAPTGENTKRKQSEYDSLGRLTSVCEITSVTGSGTCSQTSSATGFWTTYSYDLNNNLTGVTQNAQSSSTQTRSYSYDDLGRMTSETNPESGTTYYVYDYDSACGTTYYYGDLVKVTDAVGNATCYAYDALHRVTSVTYPSGSYASVTPSKYFAYDSATVNSVSMSNAKTHLAEAYTCTSCPGTKITDMGFSYTARGEQSELYESTQHSSGYYHVSETYWENGAVNTISGLSGLPTITYGLDGEGRTSTVSASSGQNPVTATAYNDYSSPPNLQVTFGSGDSDQFNYDANTGRMTQYSFSVNGSSVVGSLTWNAMGTLASLGITDPFNSSDAQTCYASHDDLSRISSWDCGSGKFGQGFSYDSFGNITKSVLSGRTGTSFAPTYSTSTNRMTLIGSSTPTYDSDGNVTNDFLHTYAWDSNGKPVTIDSVSATYDALGDMVEQNRSGTYTEIAYAPDGGKLGLMSGTTLQTGFVPLTGGATAVYNSSGLAYYRHSDWLGSSRFASTPTGPTSMYSDTAYGPFGETYAQAGTTDPSFTTMNQDTASADYDFQAREYGVQGRWPSPDPAGIGAANPGNPQSWNRYAYVLNDPLALTDPDGMDPLIFSCNGGNWYGTPGGCTGGPPEQAQGPGATCMVDGIGSTCGLALALLNSGAGVPCYASPDFCSELTVSVNGTLQQFVPGPPPGTDPPTCEGICSVTTGHYVDVSFSFTSWDPSQPLPADPSGLGPDWQRDYGHRAPNDERYVNPNGDKLDWHKGIPGKEGWKGKDHWHWNEHDWHFKPGDKVKNVATAITVGIVAYWVISEVSRLFPPRDLVPVP